MTFNFSNTVSPLSLTNLYLSPCSYLETLWLALTLAFPIIGHLFPFNCSFSQARMSVEKWAPLSGHHTFSWYPHSASESTAVKRFFPWKQVHLVLTAALITGSGWQSGHNPFVFWRISFTISIRVKFLLSWDKNVDDTKPESLARL